MFPNFLTHCIHVYALSSLKNTRQNQMSTFSLHGPTYTCWPHLWLDKTQAYLVTTGFRWCFDGVFWCFWGSLGVFSCFLMIFVLFHDFRATCSVTMTLDHSRKHENPSKATKEFHQLLACPSSDYQTIFTNILKTHFPQAF